MHLSMSSFLKSNFYPNQLLDAPNDRSRSHKCCYLPGKLFGPFSFINIPEGREEMEADGDQKNLVEVAIVLKVVQLLYSEWGCCGEKLSICVMSPYASQVVEIKRKLGQRYEDLKNFMVKVMPTEAVQGAEEDIVIISTVRSNSTGSIGFISDCQRTNVASTRARHCLWVLGNEKALAADPIFEAVILKAKECDCFFNANDDERIAKVIIDVKSKLDQLDDLLNKDSPIFKGARWKVLFSENFVKSFSRLPSVQSKKLVLNFLFKLSNGWRPKKKQSDPVCESSVKIAKQYKVEGRYIICTNDVVRESGYATQVLKVWDILHLKDVPDLVRKLDNIYGAYSEDFLMYCKQKCLEGCLEVPRCYASYNVSRFKDFNNTDSTNVLKANNSGSSYPEKAKVKESLILMKFYSLSADAVSHLLSACDSRALNMPFEVTDEERDMISYQRSTFVLGRSGTGKTTVLMMKLFQKEELHQILSEGFCKSNALRTSSTCSEACASETVLRQLFVTVNPKLCCAVKLHVSNLRRVAHGEPFGEERLPIDVINMDEFEEFKDIPNSFVEIPRNSYPLVITFFMFLLMLDGTVGSSYFDRFPDIRKIYGMELTSSRMVALQTIVKRKEVTYDKFCSSYWPHFDSQLTRYFDPSRVFAEINSCIKGGLESELRDDSKLCLNSYLRLSEKRISNFNEEERKMIYTIFMDYEKKKSLRREFDLADLVTDLHTRLKRELYRGDLMDFIYIDEVQDLTMKQISLFKYICKNVEGGFVFAGDTAQTIARGVDFRFEDIRCLFYREFLHGVETNAKERKQDKGKISPIFNLSQNFRTHGGLVKLAQSVIDLLYHFFPLSIDKLNPESSLLYGEAPVLLDCGSDGDAIMKIFQNNGNNGESMINFGSEQVILVRDDCARAEISNYIGKQALVLTIFECKGLEFQDVMLYNFFGSSPCKDQWRLIYNYMEKNMLCSLNRESNPSFSHARHNVLCYELKQLYVAITRTRQRLWICESQDGLSSPMFDYWRKLNVVQVRKFDDSFARSMEVASSQEDWRLRGIKMLEVCNYKAAEVCFDRAGDPYWKTFARAAGLKAAAGNMHGSRLEKSLEMLRLAAKLFESINNAKEAAKCYFDAEDYEKAGTIFYSESDVQRAGQCFTLAGCYDRAAKVYAKENLFYECLYACSEGKLYDLGLSYVRSWRHQVDVGDITWKTSVDLNAAEQKFLQKCAIASFKQHDKEAMMKYVNDFCSQKCKRTFLKKWGCFAELMELEAGLGNFLDAAKIARHIGDILSEADLLDKAGHGHEASKLYLAYVLASSLWADGGKGWPLKEFPLREEFLSKAKTSSEDILLLTDGTLDLPELEKQLELSKREQNLRGQIMCARRILDILFQTDISMYEWERDIVGNSSRYSETISMNRVPIKALIDQWNFWKEKIVTIVKSLDSQNQPPCDYLGAYVEFCLEYLGVRKQSDAPNSSYFLLYPDAEWIKHAGGFSGKKAGISKHQLVTTAKYHWCLELLQVGMKLLKTLESLDELVIKHSMPTSCSSWVRIHFFEAAQFLTTKCNFLKMRSDVNDPMRLLLSYFDLSTEKYFCSVFSLDNRMLMSKEIIMQSEASRNLLKEALLKKIMVRVGDGEEDFRKPALAQLSRATVLLLGSNRRSNEKYRKAMSKMDLVNIEGQGASDISSSRNSEGDSSIFHQLRDVLDYVYISCWALICDDISPPCFLYLLERMLLLVSCFNRWTFVTRSYVIEWLIHLDWKVDWGMFTMDHGNSSSIVQPILDFLANTAHQLLMNQQDTQEWVKEHDLENSLHFLVLRLVVIMCLIYLNSGRYLELLNDVLNRPYILSLLPKSFVKVLNERDGCSFAKVVAEALLNINDPLVVIKRERVPPNLYSKHAIHLQVFNRNREGVLENLFRENVRAVTSHK